ncbi:hypothetical protein C8J56DRAFT_1004583 [Mycena floridula]|nr:hypothetical protein C8J56DRAFT_1004583 [Mycena floridula]
MDQDSPPKEPVPSSEPPNTSSGPLDESDSKDDEHEEENPYVWDFSPPAGIPINNTTQLPTQFEEICAAQIAAGLPPWAPFQSKDEWDMVHWMMKSDLSQAKIDEFLKSKLVGWSCELLDVQEDCLDDEGNKVIEEIEFWRHDSLECIKELMVNPAFKDHLHYAPEQQFLDKEKTNWVYSNSWTADWWWQIQKQRLPEGATVVPIILSSNKTQLSRFSGDKQAWPVYLSLSNIPKDIHHKPSEQAMVLVGYLPVYEKKRLSEGYRLFHDAMTQLLEPLKKAGLNSVAMMCADGFVCHVYKIVMAYIADWPKQVLIAGCKNTHCPCCLVLPGERGNTTKSDPHTQEDTLGVLYRATASLQPDELDTHGIKLIDPFWADLLHCDIFSSFTPDLLHQLHKGVFKDHVSSWVTQCFPGDMEDKRKPEHMEKVFVGVAAGTITNKCVILVVKSALDFIYYSHFEFHMTISLQHLHTAWEQFHENKDIFLEEEIRKDFDIPKVHQMRHYIQGITLHGTADGFNTEGTERLHIDFCKVGYTKSNRRGFTKQMTKWLDRQESVGKFTWYLEWAIPEYLAPVETIDIDMPDDEESVKAVPVKPIDVGEGQVQHFIPVPNTVKLPQYEIAKNPPSEFKCVSVDAIEGPVFEQNMCPCDFHRISTFVSYPVFRQFTINIPPTIQCTEHWTTDPIRASPYQPWRGTRAPIPAHFDTVIARKYPAPPSLKASKLNEFDPKVHVIFHLPEAYGIFHEPLAFVEWFTAFTMPHEYLGLH